MSLKCSKAGCSAYELASAEQLAFFQDVNNGGWNLGLGPEFVISETKMPHNIRLVDTSDVRFPYNAICARCMANIGKVNTICGFDKMTVNFSAKHTTLLQSKSSYHQPSGSQKWGKIFNSFPQIRKIVATPRTSEPIVGSATVHFNGLSDLQQMIQFAKAVSERSNLDPRRYQWRSYFFSCLNNTLLCLATGMGKTLIANMLMYAYKQQNPGKGQVFVVPTIVLVEQQAKMLERNTGMKVERLSGEHKKEKRWEGTDICVCTYALLVNAIRMKQIDASQLSLVVLDEVHDANSPNSTYGQLLPLITKCQKSQRPRILGLSASPSGVNSTNMRESISSLCTKLCATPFSPLVDDDLSSIEAKQVTCDHYIPIHKSAFEVRFEDFVIESIDRLAKLHKYYIDNYTPSPPNISVTQKIDNVIKILGQATLVAQNENNWPLIHLTRWIRKWIDSLDMLQIFGPRKLLEFIREDLNTARQSKDLQSVSVQLFPILFSMESTINSIERDYSIPEDSPRVAELIRQVKSHQNDQARILVFVDRRVTAERLCRRLKEDPDIGKLNPNFVVGNADSGMPKEVQEGTLQSFHEGTCQILVATAVLEQGIDVTACGVVIRYDGVMSMRSIIQSRGRARQNFAKFIVLVSDDKKAKANELRLMEASMDLAVRQLMKESKISLDQQLTIEINKFLESDHANFSISPAIAEADDDEDEDEEVPKENEVFHLQFRNFIDADDLSNHVKSFFTSKLDRLKIKRKLITARFVIPANDNNSIVSIVQKISTRNEKSSNLRSWIEVIKPVSDAEDRTVIKFLELSFSSLMGFHFNGPTNVSVDRGAIWNSPFKVQFTHNEMKIINGPNHFSIHIIDVEGPILMNEQNNSLEVFLCLRNPPSYYVDNERACYDFSNSSFNLRLFRDAPTNPKDSWNLRKALLNFSLQVTNVCHLVEKYADDHSQLETIRFSPSETFQRDYLIKVWHSKYAAVLPAKLPNFFISQLNKSSVSTVELLLHNSVPVRFQPLHLQLIGDVELPFPEWDPPFTYAMFPRIKVTPSRVIFLPKQAVTKNRVFRYFPDPENFLLVSFTDEHDGNPWGSAHVYARFFMVLLHGIEVGGKNFSFLGCSNSQLRIGRCWFSCLDRQTVYDKIGDFPDSMNAGRKLTRIALAFASSIETVTLNHEKYLKNVAPDVVEGKFTFSDGIGRASPRTMQNIQSMLNISERVSAFQIRVGGIKGVISLFDEQKDDVMFRKSMKKFESEHNVIEVLNHSRPTKLYLNRHVILLLFENEIADEVLMDLQHEELLGCLKALMQDDTALAFVKSRSTVFNWESLPEAHIPRDPFFRQLLMSNATELVQQIVENARVSVPNGRVLMGVMDETGTLEFGEVYANIIEDDFTMELEGRVLVFRNPCVLPSDIRVLNACKRDRLRKIYQNCLVFPSKGKSSHPSECAGGDLDGDLYYVIWDKGLVPNFVVPGRDVVENEPEDKSTKTTGNSDVEMMKFFCDYISKNQLGIIANAHLASADKLGMDHVHTVQLAKYVAAETDAPKKGLTVGIIDSKYLPDEYPDYMQKLDKPSYRSGTILGDMFRHAKPLLDVLLEKRKLITPPRTLVLSSTQDTVEQNYVLYSFEINKLLMSFDLESEVDLFSGTPMWRKGYMSAFKQQTQHRLNVNELVKAFWAKWTNIFEEWRAKTCSDQQKINDWYNYPDETVNPVRSFSYLAMPHVDFEETERWSMSQAILNSTSLWVKNNNVYWLDEWRKRHQVGETVIEQLKNIQCYYYGSSMLGLNEDYSDVDMFAAVSDISKLCNSLKAIDENAFSQEKPHACVSLTIHSLPVDVTNFFGGVQKTNGLAEEFDERPEMWGALRVLIEWARTVSIVKSGGGRGLMPVISFCHLFIYHAKGSPPRVANQATPYTLARLDKWIESVKFSSAGKLIFDFLTFLSDRKNRSWIVNKKDPLSGDALIPSSDVSELRKNAEIALYFLAVHDGDVQKLFQLCMKKRLFRIDKRYMNSASHDTERQLQCFREIKKKCNPTRCKELKLELKERNGVFFLEATGDHKLFLGVERGLNQIHTRITSTGIRSLSHTYHVKNGTILLPEFGYGEATAVSFTPYTSDLYMPQHTGIYKSTIIVRNMNRNQQWSSDSALRYQATFLQQLKLYKQKQRNVKRGQQTWRFFGDVQCNIRVGNHYVFNVPESLCNTFETITLKHVEGNIAFLEEAFAVENCQAIIEEMKNYNRSTLLKPVEKEAPIELMALSEMKMRTGQQKKLKAQVPTIPKKKLNGIRHSFAPNWSHSLEDVSKFALLNGFKALPFENKDFYFNITVHWRQRELVVSCDKLGIIQEIAHRKTRWLSASMKRADQDIGDDLRFYLECRATLDDDESILETIVDALRGRSVFKDSFMQELDEHVEADQMLKKPLISKMMQFNWRFRAMRFITPALKFINAEGDILLLQDVRDGVFRAETCDFEWFPKHYELEIRMNMKNRSDIDLSKRSYEIGLSLFNFTKMCS